MAGDEGSSEEIRIQLADQKEEGAPRLVNPCEVPRARGNTPCDQVSGEETAGRIVYKIEQTFRTPHEIFKASTIDFVNPFQFTPIYCRKSYDQVSKDETPTAYVYKMDKKWLTADEGRVEIRRGRALRVIGRGDEPVKVELPRNSKMRAREATASMSPDGVLTVVIPKRQRKWYEFTDLVFLWFKTVHVGISR